MINKPARRASITFAMAIALTQLMASNVAQADSVREWGYWDAATAAGPGDDGNGGFSEMTTSQNTNTNPNVNTGETVNNDQNLSRFDRGTFNTENEVTFVNSSYVGYTLCIKRCKGKQAKTAGTIQVDVVRGVDPVAEKGGIRYFDGELNVAGKFNGKKFNLNDSDPTIAASSRGTYASAEQGKKQIFMNGVEIDTPFEFGGLSHKKASGTFIYGTPVSATQIAQQMNLGHTYHFKGFSYLGSNVNIAVDFKTAKWNGKWGASKQGVKMKGFTAKGKVSGSTLFSTKVAGIGKKTKVGFVKGGKVNATLVGAIKGADASKSAVIGKTVVNVVTGFNKKGKAKTTKVGDLFHASASTPKVIKLRPALAK